jgi:hypothetical protein
MNNPCSKVNRNSSCIIIKEDNSVIRINRNSSAMISGPTKVAVKVSGSAGIVQAGELQEKSGSRIRSER